MTHYAVGESLVQQRARIRVIPAGSVAVGPANLFQHSWVDTLARARHQIYSALEVQRGSDPSDQHFDIPWLSFRSPSRSPTGTSHAPSPACSRECRCGWPRCAGFPRGAAPLRGPDGAAGPQRARPVGERTSRRKGWRWGPPPKDRRVGRIPFWSTGRSWPRPNGRRTGTASGRSRRCWPWSGSSCSPTKTNTAISRRRQACPATTCKGLQLAHEGEPSQLPADPQHVGGLRGRQPCESLEPLGRHAVEVDQPTVFVLTGEIGPPYLHGGREAGVATRAAGGTAYAGPAESASRRCQPASATDCGSSPREDARGHAGEH